MLVSVDSASPPCLFEQVLPLYYPLLYVSTVESCTCSSGGWDNTCGRRRYRQDPATAALIIIYSAFSRENSVTASPNCEYQLVIERRVVSNVIYRLDFDARRATSSRYPYLDTPLIYHRNLRQTFTLTKSCPSLLIQPWFRTIKKYDVFDKHHYHYMYCNFNRRVVDDRPARQLGNTFSILRDGLSKHYDR